MVRDSMVISVGPATPHAAFAVEARVRRNGLPPACSAHFAHLVSRGPWDTRACPLAAWARAALSVPIVRTTGGLGFGKSRP